LIQHGLTAAAQNHPLEAFFGPYTGTSQDMRADDALAHETYNLPEAFKGRNKFLERVLDYKIRQEDEFYTRALLPWEYTDDLHVAWEIFSFNRTLADLEPHQGVPRYVSAQQEAHTDNLLRRGLAFIIEHGFYKTERGKRHFALNLQQISDSVHTTCYFGVIHALLSGQNYYKEWHKKYGQQVMRANDLMQAERRRWAIIQKDKNGLYILDAELKHELKKEGVIPNVWVWPDKMGIYANMVGEHRTKFAERGPQANANLESGDQRTTFRGLPVFESQSFDVDFTGEPIDLMIRNQQIGSFYVLDNGSVEGTGTDQKLKGEKYIYSHDSDKFEKITFADAWANIVNKDSSGNAIASPEQNALNNVNERDVGTNGKYLMKDGTTEWEGTPADSDILILRPSQTFRMASCILAKGGSDLGSTYHGHHDFMLSDDVVRKVHVGHYTFYSKSVVKRPKNYIIVENVFSQGYVGGGGVEWHDAASFTGSAGDGSLGVGNPKSLIAIAIPKGSAPNSNVIDITGRFAPSIYDTFKDNAARIEEHYHGSGAVYKKLQMNTVDMYRSTHEDEYLTRVKRVNTVCWRGHEMIKDVKGNVKPVQLNTGHLGENIYPGLRKVLDGENSFVKDMDWASKMDLV
jgi:hypothetical protein